MIFSIVAVTNQKKCECCNWTDGLIESALRLLNYPKKQESDNNKCFWGKSIDEREKQRKIIMQTNRYVTLIWIKYWRLFFTLSENKDTQDNYKMQSSNDSLIWYVRKINSEVCVAIVSTNKIKPNNFTIFLKYWHIQPVF